MENVITYKNAVCRYFPIACCVSVSIGNINTLIRVGDKDSAVSSGKTWKDLTRKYIDAVEQLTYENEIINL